MKAIERYFQVLLFIMLFTTVLTFHTVNETIVCDGSQKSWKIAIISQYKWSNYKLKNFLSPFEM